MPVWQLPNLCRARLQPCRMVCRMSLALAAGLFGFELPNSLFGLPAELHISIPKPDRLNPVLLLTNQILASARAHFRGVHGAGGNIAALTCSKSARLAALRQRHFAVKDDVRRLDAVRVVGIESVRSILPDIRMQKSFPMQLLFQ